MASQVDQYKRGYLEEDAYLSVLGAAGQYLPVWQELEDRDLGFAPGVVGFIESIGAGTIE
jgi:hypothetical protein